MTAGKRKPRLSCTRSPQRKRHSDTDTPASVAASSHWILGKAPPTSPGSSAVVLLYLTSDKTVRWAMDTWEVTRWNAMCACGRVTQCGGGIYRCDRIMVAIRPVSGQTVGLLFVGPAWDRSRQRTRLSKARPNGCPPHPKKKDLKRRSRMLIFWINNKMSHLFSACPVCATQSLLKATPPPCDSSTFSFGGVFISATVIFCIFRFSTAHTVIIVVNKRVACSAREEERSPDWVVKLTHFWKNPSKSITKLRFCNKKTHLLGLISGKKARWGLADTESPDTCVHVTSLNRTPLSSSDLGIYHDNHSCAFSPFHSSVPFS